VTSRAGLKSIASVVIAQLDMVVVMAGSFVVTPAMIHALGDSAYGGWLLMNSFIGYMKLLDLGATAGTVKFGSGALARNDDEDVARVMRTSSTIFVCVACVTLVAGLVLALVLPQIYPNVLPNAFETIFILGVTMAIDLGFRPFAAALRMRSLFFVYDGFELLTYSIFKLGLLLYFAHEKKLDYRTLALLNLAETVTRLTLVTIAAIALNPAARKVNPFRPTRGMVRKLATMGLAVSIIQIADILRFQVDAAVIGFMLPERPDGIAIFGVGTRLAGIAYYVIGAISAVLVPRFSGLDETADKAGLADLLRKANTITGLVSVFLLTNLAVVGPQFLMLWLGKPWVVTSGHILLVLLPAYFILGISLPNAAMLFAGAKLRGLTTLNATEAVANLVLSAALVRPLGLYGVALGTAIPLAVFRGVIFPKLVERETGLPVRAYWRQHLRIILVLAVYLVLVGGLSTVSFSGYPAFFLTCIASTAVFVVLTSLMIPETRAMVRERIARLRNRAR
jgi:O-antigen/teichoic acid export membrane protein